MLRASVGLKFIEATLQYEARFILTVTIQAREWMWAGVKTRVWVVVLLFPCFLSS